MPAPCWNFQQVMSLKSAAPLCPAGSGCMDKHPSYVEQTFYRQVSGPESIKNCSLRRRSAMLEWGTPLLSELSQVKHQAPSSKQSVVSRQAVVSDRNSTLTGRTHDWLSSSAPCRRSPGEKLNTYLRRLRVGESWHFSRGFLVFHDDGIQPPRTFAARGRPYYPVGSLRAPK